MPRSDNFWNEKKPRYRKRRSAKDAAIAQWRGFWEPDDTTANERGQIQDVVGITLKRLGLQNRFDEEKILRAWNSIVGDFVAQNSRPVEVKRKILFVQVLQPAVHYSLDRMKGEVLARVQREFGAENIRDIKFRVG